MLFNALGAYGLVGIDRLLCFMIVTDLQKFSDAFRRLVSMRRRKCGRNIGYFVWEFCYSFFLFCNINHHQLKTDKSLAALLETMRKELEPTSVIPTSKWYSAAVVKLKPLSALFNGK
jgi:hypothetical protein